MRQRSLINALSTELFGESLAIPDFPVRPDLLGIGLTDWAGFAVGLAQRLSYTNTYYHQEPFLDITSVDSSQFGRYDFILASDVFEHIGPPVSIAFQNARRLLKPRGVMIFTVPYVTGETREHFPELNVFSLEKRESEWILCNQTVDGRIQEFSDLTFHGGPGSVLEMRVFGYAGLLRCIRTAGFETVQIYEAERPENGILWPPNTPENAPYRVPFHGVDTPPWALRNGGLDAN